MAIYTTSQGDMWDSIAHEKLGGSLRADRLMAANREVRGYYVFPAGIALELPEMGAEAPGTLPPWKRAEG
jgi:phage tail protein X